MKVHTFCDKTYDKSCINYKKKRKLYVFVTGFQFLSITELEKKKGFLPKEGRRGPLQREVDRREEEGAPRINSSLAFLVVCF